MEKVNFRTKVLSRHLKQETPILNVILQSLPCLSYNLPELSEPASVFYIKEMRKLMDGHNLEERDWFFGLILQSKIFNPVKRGGKVFLSPDYSQSKEQQRQITLRRIQYLVEHGFSKDWPTIKGPEDELRKLALLDCLFIYDHSLSIKMGVHFLLWGGAIQFFGTKRHHDKWLKDTEDYVVKGCFSMTELGHGSNVRGIETVTTYDSSTGEFVINTPCESAQKYWIGGAANHATHTIVFSQLIIDGGNQGVHAFIAQIRDENGDICPNIRIADCGHKIGLNGVDNGRIWFDNVRVPRENLLNSVADVSPDGKYLTAIKDPDQRFAAFLSPLTSGRVTIASSAVYSAKIGLATAIRYSLTRRAFSVTPNGPEVLILDYPSHQRRLLPHWQVSKALFGEYVAVKRSKKPFKGLGLEHMNTSRPVIPSQLTSSTMRQAQFRNDIFCLRERDLLERFAAEVSQCQAQGKSKEYAFTLNYQLAEDLGRAFSDRAVLHTFLDAEASVTSGPLKNVLDLVRSMYVLVTLEEDAAFLRYGYLLMDNAAIVRKEVAKQCSELRPHALSLVSSFGLPDAFLSPIAFNWVEANASSSEQN
ncbi:acyl-coenzyme A oxidase 3, peroxisomal-like [Solanum verrucosum]|uniref:acyl-coenzyme A oxidase 3, peroxisomal-like n=1 Tax=Solanum verrucosum TaxID=315347 RepID=UPI0020D17DC1|nr:acyl-coenzyme A oxidase 3, peroxisomal-like [Solanum verrucosum]